MADRTTEELDAVFAALADPTRRAIVARLAKREASVSDLAAPFDMSLPGVTKHLAVLEQGWGPGEFTTPHAGVDLRPGGKYVLVMQLPGGDPMRLAGRYREVEPPERLVYTWRWESGNPDTTESVVTVEFHDLDGRT